MAGPWPEEFELHYQASVEDNERAVLKDEEVILIPLQDARIPKRYRAWIESLEVGHQICE